MYFSRMSVCVLGYTSTYKFTYLSHLHITLYMNIIKVYIGLIVTRFLMALRMGLKAFIDT